MHVCVCFPNELRHSLPPAGEVAAKRAKPERIEVSAVRSAGRTLALTRLAALSRLALAARLHPPERPRELAAHALALVFADVESALARRWRHPARRVLRVVLHVPAHRSLAKLGPLPCDSKSVSRVLTWHRSRRPAPSPASRSWRSAASLSSRTAGARHRSAPSPATPRGCARAPRISLPLRRFAMVRAGRFAARTGQVCRHTKGETFARCGGGDPARQTPRALIESYSLLAIWILPRLQDFDDSARFEPANLFAIPLVS